MFFNIKERFSRLPQLLVAASAGAMTRLAALCALVVASAAMGGQGANPLAQYVLGPGDSIRVVVFGEQDLSGDFSIGTSGLVALPLVGPLEAVGKSPGELASAITEALAPEYLRNPRVSVEVLQYRPFFILGEVKAPGSYPYAADVNVRRAAALAGGYTYRAKTGHAYITRVTGGKESRQKASPDTPLLPGDIVEIPERFF